MFGFSLQKLLVLLSILGVVWYGFKFISRLQETRETDARLRGRRKAARQTKQRSGAPADPEDADLEDMVQCPVCRTYVAARTAGPCERDDCPY